MVIGEILTWVAVACSGMLAFTVFWRRPPQPLWPSLFFVYCSALFWAFGELGSSFLARTESAYSLWLILNYTGILFLMPTWWLFSLAFAELQGRPIPWANRVVRYGPFGLAAVYWIAMISNPLHYQFHIPQIAGHNDYRIVWYIQTATNYALFLAVTCVFLWLRWRLRRSFLREQMNIMVAATAIPLICNVLFVSRVFDPGFDITVGAFTASTVLFYIGIYRTRLFILSPITLQHVIDNERNGVILVDGDFRLLQANPATTQFMDSSEIFPEVELLPLLARRLSSHENGDDPIDSESLRRALADPNQPLEGNIYCYDHPTCHWLQIDSTTLPDRRGNRLGFALRLHDITGAVQAKEALVRSEQRFRSLVKSAPVCIHEISREGRVVSMNDAGLRMMGVQREDEVCGLDYLKIPVTEDRERVANLLKRALEGESSIFEFATASETGPVYFLASFAPIKDEREKVVKLMGVSQDISNQKRAQARELELEQQLLQSQKVESLGTLAGGIAHDFNNILQSILGYTSIALENPDGNTPLLEEYLKEIERGGLRAKDLVDQILTFSRKRNVERQSLNLPPLVEEYIRFIRSTLPATIRIDSDIDFDCAQVSADTTQIHQLVTNLCTNSMHAMEETGGTLRVSLQPLMLEAPLETVSGHLEPGNYVELSVVDTGTGIDPDNFDRILDPFFTTREVGKGTGLGLSTVHGITKGMKGGLVIVSEPGRGTTVRVVLPVNRDEAQKLEPSRGEIGVAFSGEGHIMLVDDETAITKLTTLILTQNGFTVKAFNDAHSALAMVKNSSDKFDLAILDYTMPGMTGLELAAEFESLIPDTPIILATGRLDDSKSEEYRSGNVVDVLKKPFDLRALIRIVEKTMSRVEDSS